MNVPFTGRTSEDLTELAMQRMKRGEDEAARRAADAARAQQAAQGAQGGQGAQGSQGSQEGGCPACSGAQQGGDDQFNRQDPGRNQRLAERQTLGTADEGRLAEAGRTRETDPSETRRARGVMQQLHQEEGVRLRALREQQRLNPVFAA